MMPKLDNEALLQDERMRTLNFLSSQSGFIKEAYEKFKGTDSERTWKIICDSAVQRFRGMTSGRLMKIESIIRKEYARSKKNHCVVGSEKASVNELEDIIRELSEDTPSSEKPKKQLIKMKLPAIIPGLTRNLSSKWPSAKNPSSLLKMKEPQLMRTANFERRNSLPFLKVASTSTSPNKPSFTTVRSQNLVRNKVSAASSSRKSSTSRTVSLPPKTPVTQTSKVQQVESIQVKPKAVAPVFQQLKASSDKADNINDEPEENIWNFKVFQTSADQKKFVMLSLPTKKESSEEKAVAVVSVQGEIAVEENSDKQDYTLNDVKDVQDCLTSEFLKKREERRMKELRRLHENIVKDVVPLAPRRSCTLKRTTDDFKEVPTKNSSEQKNIIDSDTLSPVAKRSKAVAGSLPLEQKPSETLKKEPNVLATSSEIKRVPFIKQTPTRITRKSAAAFEVANSQAAPPEKKLKSESLESQKTEEYKKNFDLKPVSVTLSQVVSPKKPSTSINQANQVAKKSTNQRQQVYMEHQERLMAIGYKKKKKIPMRVGGTIAPAGEESYDSDWEDIDDSASSSSSQSEASESRNRFQVASPNEEVQTVQKGQIIREPESLVIGEDTIIDGEKAQSLVFRQMTNIAFTISRRGPIFACLIPDCKFKSMQKGFFVKHIESKHTKLHWNGFCKICQKSVFKPDDKAIIMMEFIHMMENHLLRETEASTKAKKIGANKELQPRQPQPITKDDIYQGIDDVIKVLMPPGGVDTNLSEHLESNESSRSQSPNQVAFEVSNFDDLEEHKLIVSPVQKQIIPKTKTISKNVVGRVIPISMIPGLSSSMLNNAKKIAMPSGLMNFQTKNQERKSLPSQITASIPTPTVRTSLGRMPSSCTSSNVITRKTSEEHSKLVFKNILDEPSTSLTVEPLVKILPAKRQMFTAPVTQPNIVVAKKSQENEKFCFQEALRPWLGIRARKNAEVRDFLLSPVVLCSTFKCLGTDCSFYTIEAKAFKTHLSLHVSCNGSDKDNFLSCAYCNFIPISGKPDHLIQHIDQEHGFDIFQCNYCFYRSCVDFNVFSHQNNFHKMKPRSIFKLETKKKRDVGKELHCVKLTLDKFVPPIVCFYCKMVFYIFKSFALHMLTHKNNTKATKCTKCGEKSEQHSVQKHLIHCHGYGLFQCVYCNYGTNTFAIISNHLANSHPSKLPMFCERTTKDPDHDRLSSRISSISLKTIKQNIPQNVVSSPMINHDELINRKNVGRLGLNINIAGRFPEEVYILKSLDPPQEAPKTETKKIVYTRPHQNIIVRKEYGLAKQIAPKVTPPPLGLQIQSVFSLSDGTMHNYKS